MTPMTVNAYANFGMNEIVFPAAILQPPFFDPKADPAINYGGIGAVIGHEISHHFDDQGSKYDETGKLADWWTPEDVKAFEAASKALVAQYDAYEVLPGEHLDGTFTLGENIGDLAGLNIAYDAYKASLGGKEAPVIDGLTGDQRFFLGRRYGGATIANRTCRSAFRPIRIRPRSSGLGSRAILTLGIRPIRLSRARSSIWIRRIVFASGDALTGKV